MKIDKRAFADRLRDALKREQIEPSAAELARLLELEGECVSQQAVSGWLNGRHRPRPAHIEALARIIGVAPYVLEYAESKAGGVRDTDGSWPDRVRGHDRMAFEAYLLLGERQRALVRELILELGQRVVTGRG